MLNAVACVWNEEDIIESSVRHAFAQGCDNVFIVDNGSTDDTVKRAEAAGAKLAVSFESAFFDEREKVVHLNAVVQHHNSLFPDDAVWWLYFDADEFPNIDGPLRLREFLHGLDGAVKAVHGHMFDHIPTHFPYHVRGYHPVDFMPLCVKSPVTKIPLVRYDKGKPHLFSAGGAHEFDTNGETLLIAHDAVNIHHFQMRSPDYTLARLKALLRRNPDGTSRLDWMDRRSKLISNQDKSQYHERYENLVERYAKYKNLALKADKTLYALKHIQRWYDDHSGMQFEGLEPYDACVCGAIFNFFMGRPELALCRFNDALELCRDDEVRAWILVRMAECFLHSDKEASVILLNRAVALCPAAGGYIRAHVSPRLEAEAEGRSGNGGADAEERIVRLESYHGAFQVDPTYFRTRMQEILERLAERSA